MIASNLVRRFFFFFLGFSCTMAALHLLFLGSFVRSDETTASLFLLSLRELVQLKVFFILLCSYQASAKC